MVEEPEDFLGDLRLNEYTKVQPTLDHLAGKLGGSVYVEDLQGRLLYTSSDAPADSWRADFTPFSQTEHPRRERLLEEWQSSLGLYQANTVNLSLKEHRVLLALTYQGDLFALVHLVSTRPQMVSLATHPHSVKVIGDKLYIVIMGTMNALRRKHAANEDSVETVRSWPPSPPPTETWYQAVAVHFGHMSPNDVQQSLIDYASIATYHAVALIDHLAAQGLGPDRAAPHLLPPRDNLLQCAVVFEYTEPDPQLPDQVEHHLQLAVEMTGWRASLGISPPFSQAEEAPDKIQQAHEIRELGSKQQTGRLVYTQQDIGIEAFLLPLTRSAELRKYAQNLVNALGHKEHILLQTLQVYIALDCNATHTAEHFHVDRRTIAYRLNRISETLGLDLGTFENKVLLYLALKATAPKRA